MSGQAATFAKVPKVELVTAKIPRHYWGVKKQHLVSEDSIDFVESFVKKRLKLLNGGFGYTLQCDSLASLSDAASALAVVAKICVAHSLNTLFLDESELLDIYAGTFDKTASSQEMWNKLYEYEVLLLHGLNGASRKSFASEAVQKLIRKRVYNTRTTIVSTDLGPEEFKSHYSEQAWADLEKVNKPITIYAEVLGKRGDDEEE